MVIPSTKQPVLSVGAVSVNSLTLGPGALASLTVTGATTSLTLGGGNSTISSSLRVLSGATLNLGTMTTWDNGTIGGCDTGFTCTINIGAGDTLAAGAVVATTGAGTGGTTYWHNLGTITAAAGGGVTDFRGVFENDGAVDVQSGVMQISDGDGAGTTDGTFTVASGATLRTAATDFGAGASVSGAGSLDAASGTTQFLAGSSLAVARLDLVGGIFSTAIPVSVPEFNCTADRRGAGEVTATTTASLTGTCDLSGGATNLQGSTQITGIVNLHTGEAVHFGTSTTWSGGAINGCFGGGSCTIDIPPGGTFDIQGNPPALQNTPTLTWTNRGTLRRSAGATNLSWTPPLVNEGTFEVMTGTLTAASFTQPAGSTIVDAGATLAAAIPVQGGTLSGNGTVNGDVTNSGGTVAPGSSPGHLTISGNYTQGPAGTLAVDVASSGQGLGYDWLDVTGTAVVDGTLAIASAAGFDPPDASTYDFLTAAGGLSGTFAVLTGDKLATRRYYPAYAASGASLHVQAAATNVTRPAIGGSAVVGQALTCDPGAWSGAVSLTYQWLRDGATIAAGATYTLVRADAGTTLVCRVTASDANGSTTSDSPGVSIAAAPLSTASLPPECALPSQPAVPTPVLFRFVVVQPLRSGVTYQLPGCPVQADLDRALLIPVDTIVDATKGRLLLTSARGRGGTQSITLYAGAFEVRQRRTDKPRGLTEFGLAGKGLPLAGSAGAAAGPKKRKKPNLKAVRKLWADGTGDFRTRGLYATAVIRGTKWLTIDRFNTTVIQVVRGAVLVSDLLRNAQVVVRAGESYEAQATATYLNRVRTNPRYGKRYSILRTRTAVFHIYRDGRRIKVR